MTITPVGLEAVTSKSAVQTQGTMTSQASARTDSGEIPVRFAPGEGHTGPLDRVGAGVISKLKQFEAQRMERSKAMSKMSDGPASAVDAAKAELLSGPANSSGTHGPSPATASSASRVEDAVSAMTRSFDYAIETQLIVKTGSQLSASATSMMRGQ